MVVAAVISGGISALSAVAASRSKLTLIDEPLVAEASVRDLGLVRQGQKSDVAFNVRNAGSVDVSILDVRTSCSCTRPTVRDSRLAEGDTTRISAAFDASRNRGSITTSLAVVYRVGGEVKRRELQLHIKANVEPEISVDHDLLIFDAGAPASRVLGFKCAEWSKVRVVEAFTTHCAFTATLDRERGLVDVRFDPERAADLRFAQLCLSTDSQCEPIVEIPLRLSRKEMR